MGDVEHELAPVDSLDWQPRSHLADKIRTRPSALARRLTSRSAGLPARRADHRRGGHDANICHRRTAVTQKAQHITSAKIADT